MTKVKTTKWDSAKHLTSPESIMAYLEAAMEDGDPAVISMALGNIARAQGMSSVATATGVARSALYKALSPEGQPTFATVLKVLKALGFGVRPVLAKPVRKARSRSAAKAAGNRAA